MKAVTRKTGKTSQTSSNDKKKDDTNLGWETVLLHYFEKSSVLEGEGVEDYSNYYLSHP